CGHGRLSNLNEVAIRIAHVAPHLRCMDFGLGDELRAPGRPELVVAFDITHAKVQKVAEDIWIAWRPSDDVRLIVGPSASAVDRQPDVAEPKKRRLSLTQHRGPEHVPIKSDRALDIANDERICNNELQFSALVRPSRHVDLLSQGWYPSAIHLAKSSI